MACHTVESPCHTGVTRARLQPGLALTFMICREDSHISIDVGMLDLYRGGHQVAFCMEGDLLWAIHPLGIVKLPESTQADYYIEVAAVAHEKIEQITSRS